MTGLRGTAVLAHGFTLDEVDRLARTAVAGMHLNGVSTADAYDDAWSTIVEQIYAAAEPPEHGHLVTSARYAMYRGYRDDNHHHGLNSRDPDGRKMAGYVEYWDRQTAASPEDAVVEQVAFAQIWPRLSPTEQLVITAIAVWGSPKAAAAATGRQTQATVVAARAARTRFLTLWHEGETRSAKWGAGWTWRTSRTDEAEPVRYVFKRPPGWGDGRVERARAMAARRAARQVAS